MPVIRPTAACISILSLVLAACGGDNQKIERRAGSASDESALPTPERGDGSVTGMPDAPGPGEVAITGAPPPPPPDLLPIETLGLPPLEDNPETGLLADDGAAMTGAEPGVPGAVAVVRNYYAAINARDFNRAYVQWSDGGRSSGQSPDQFANGFSRTAGITAEIGEPGQVQGAAGSRLIEVPVSVISTRQDGDVRRYRGTYVLRQAVVDGASSEQRAWRIASADLREVQP